MWAAAGLVGMGMEDGAVCVGVCVSHEVARCLLGWYLVVSSAFC